MVNGGNRILFETFDEDGLNELIEEAELKSNETFNMNNLDVNELQFETETSIKYLFLFSKDDNQYQISYFEPADDEEEYEDTDDAKADEEETEDANTEENTTEEESSEDADESSFDINNPENPVNVLINSLKF